jgi:hypothetical protein
MAVAIWRAVGDRPAGVAKASAAIIAMPNSMTRRMAWVPFLDPPAEAYIPGEIGDTQTLAQARTAGEPGRSTWSARPAQNHSR